MLNVAEVKLELISDADMYLLFEKSMKCGASYISKRYSKANNKYIKSYDSKQESNHYINLDVNNLYGYATSKFLPTGGFKWIDPKEFNLNRYTSNSSKGCVIEVDFEYQKELHQLHNDYPLAPDKTDIKEKVLSSCQLKTADLYNIHFGTVKKLVSNFFNKEKYVPHYQNLQLYLRLVSKLRKYIGY